MSDPAPAPSLVRFDRRDAIFVAACVVLSLACGVFGWSFREKAFPEASIDFKVTRDESRELGAAFLKDSGLMPAEESFGPEHAATFDWNDTERLFLERSFGLEKTNALTAGPVKLFRWSHRWFTPLEKEEWRVDVTPGGEVVYAERLVQEEWPAPSLSVDEARVLAERFFHETLGRPRDGWEPLDSRTFDRPARQDHQFTWKRRGMPELDALESSYRAQVTVLGDRVGSFGEWVQVPEKWTRDYQALRAGNETAGAVDAVFMSLTMLAVLVMFLVHARRRDVKWKLAAAFAVVGAVLAIASSLNQIPQALWFYDTTESMPGFLAQQGVQAVVAGLGLAVFIFLLTAAGEPEYRRDLGGQVALGALFSARGLRTKTAFRSVVLGLTLCAFFIAYQVVFYLAATRFGAWSPQDIAYDDLLNTRFPWTAVLLIGFMPAVTEEFMSRMFSIPFFTRFMRWRWVAVVVAAAIWGFAHSGYPQQPFWIRGAEVGLAGVIIGVIMLRYGILAPLVWHYTVDALLTGLLMLRSESLYFKATAALAILWTLVPLALCLIWYVRRGGFEPEDDLLNRAQPVPEPRPAREAAPAPEPATYRPLGGRALLAVGALALVAIAVKLAAPAALDEATRVTVSREQALGTAEARLRALGVEGDDWKVVAVLGSDYWQTGAKYLVAEGASWDELLTRWTTDLDALYWRVRWFRPGQKEEWRLSVSTRDGSLVSEEHWIDEAAPGATLEEAEARAEAVRYLAGHGVDVTAPGWEQKEARSDARPNRRDWNFVWENASHVRERAWVMGDEPSGRERWLHVPEGFQRDRDERRLWNTALTGLRFALAAAAALGLLALLVHAFVRHAFPVKAALVAGSVVALLELVGAGLNLPGVLFGYATSEPWGLFVAQSLVYSLLSAVGSGLGAAVLVGVALSAWPQHAAEWRGHRRDAWLGALALAATGLLAAGLRAHLDAAWPAAALPGMNAPWGLSALLAGPYEIAGWLAGAVTLACGFALLAHLHERWLRSPWLRALGFVVAAIAVFPDSARTAGEALASLAPDLLRIALAYAVVRWIWRGNPLAFAVGAGAATALAALAPLAQQPLAEARTQGAIAAALALAVLVVATLRARPLPPA